MAVLSAPVPATPAATPGWRESAYRSLRVLSAVTAAATVAGLLVGGIGGRLAMLLLARLNPAAHGIRSDDGFTMGQLTLGGTASLLLVGTAIGVVGAAFYGVLRGLLVGPRWFQVASVSIGPAVVVGEMLVHTDGVDFRLLRPLWLAIGLFVVLPGAYAALLTVLAERWAAPGAWFSRAPLRLALLPLLVWPVLVLPVPFVLAVVLLWAVREALRRTSAGAAALAHPAGPWGLRAALAVLFVASTIRLADEVVTLTSLS